MFSKAIPSYTSEAHRFLCSCYNSAVGRAAISLLIAAASIALVATLLDRDIPDVDSAYYVIVFGFLVFMHRMFTKQKTLGDNYDKFLPIMPRF